jgi:dTDP-4-amino-4,6-dideoxygalactose transaminase
MLMYSLNNGMEQVDSIYVTRASMPSYEEYIEAIKPLWDSHFITNMAHYHQQLENELACYLQVPELSLTVNGHMALELTIQSFDFPDGGEVITTPFTFISTTHAIVRNRLKPVFCDINETDGTIDETKIEELITPKTVAIMPVHVFGNVCNVECLERIAYKYGLKVIYDAAHAFGVKYKGIGVGNYGDASIFSFHATKVFNTIEGGAVVCKNHEMYEKLYNLKNFGIRGESLTVSVGANAKMNEFAAIMGLCNMRHIAEVHEKRKRCHDKYVEKLSKINGIRILHNKKDQSNNYAYFPIVIEGYNGDIRERIYNSLNTIGIHARKYFYPITADQACFRNQYKNDDLIIARKMSNAVLCLPIFDGLDDSVIEVITDKIEEVFGI